MAFYQPTKERFKVLLEKDCFPSDFVSTTRSALTCTTLVLTFLLQYAVQSQVCWHSYDPKEAMIIMSPREVSTQILSLVVMATSHCSPQGEHVWRTEDVVKLIEEQGDDIALVWLPGRSRGQHEMTLI